MSEHVYWITAGLLFGTPLLIFGMKYLSAAHQARSRAMSDGAYRELAAKAVAAQAETAAALSEIKTRLAAVEKILKAVE
jgi:hypothetical protein